MRGPSLPREEHKSGINSVRRKSGDFKKSLYTPVGPSAKKYRGKEDKKKRRTRAITETRSWVPLGRKRRAASAYPARSCRGQQRETNGDREGSDWTPEERQRERERGKARREPLGGIVRYIDSPRQVVFFSCRMTQSREELPDRISRGGPPAPL